MKMSLQDYITNGYAPTHGSILTITGTEQYEKAKQRSTGASMGKAMTVNQLLKKLTKLKEQGHGRRYVSIRKPTFEHPLEADGVTTLNVYDCRLDTMLRSSDDGGCEVDSKGRERTVAHAVLFGYADDTLSSYELLQQQRSKDA